MVNSMDMVCKPLDTADKEQFIFFVKDQFRFNKLLYLLLTLPTRNYLTV